MKKIYIIIITSLIGFSGCKKLVDVGLPENQLTAEDIFADSASVTSTVAGMYSFMYNYQSVDGSPYKSFITTLFSLAADETRYFSGNTYPQFERNAIPVADVRNLQLWADSYKVIYYANNIIEHIDMLTSSSAAFRNQVKGEATFIRAFCMFYLTNIFGDVPIVETTDFKVSSVIPRSKQAEVYKKITEDLNAARTLLAKDDSYSEGGERTRANYYAATAMLARVYLYMGLNNEAEATSSEVIQASASYSLEMDLDNVFQSSSSETIFQFPTNVNSATYVAQDFLPGISSNVPNFILRDELLDDFEVGDKRQDAWIGTVDYGGEPYFFPHKYQLNNGSEPSGRTEYDVVLRLTEQYLIRAEARIRLGLLDGATDDVNEIRKRADVDPIVVSDPETMLEQLAHERRVEMFCEWGHRWFDLKRTNKAGVVLSPIKPTWKNTAVLFPVPQQAINTNRNLLPQNEGYN